MTLLGITPALFVCVLIAASTLWLMGRCVSVSVAVQPLRSCHAVLRDREKMRVGKLKYPDKTSANQVFAQRLDSTGTPWP